MNISINCSPCLISDLLQQKTNSCLTECSISINFDPKVISQLEAKFRNKYKNRGGVDESTQTEGTCFSTSTKSPEFKQNNAFDQPCSSKSEAARDAGRCKQMEKRLSKAVLFLPGDTEMVHIGETSSENHYLDQKRSTTSSAQSLLREDRTASPVILECVAQQRLLAHSQLSSKSECHESKLSGKVFDKNRNIASSQDQNCGTVLDLPLIDLTFECEDDSNYGLPLTVNTDTLGSISQSGSGLSSTRSVPETSSQYSSLNKSKNCLCRQRSFSNRKRKGLPGKGRRIRGCSRRKKLRSVDESEGEDEAFFTNPGKRQKRVFTGLSERMQMKTINASLPKIFDNEPEIPSGKMKTRIKTGSSNKNLSGATRVSEIAELSSVAEGVQKDAETIQKSPDLSAIEAKQEPVLRKDDVQKTKQVARKTIGNKKSKPPDSGSGCSAMAI